MIVSELDNIQMEGGQQTDVRSIVHFFFQNSLKSIGIAKNQIKNPKIFPEKMGRHRKKITKKFNPFTSNKV